MFQRLCRIASTPFLASAWALLLLTGCSGARGDVSPAPSSVGARRIQVGDTASGLHEPLRVTGARAHVLLFTAVGCERSASYAPEISRLMERFSEKGIRFLLIDTGGPGRADEVQRNARELGYSQVVLLDPEHELVRELGVRVTPEAVVALPDGMLVYRGRIDDLWTESGVARDEPRYRDLEEALEGVVAGKRGPRIHTLAAGTPIPSVDPDGRP